MKRLLSAATLFALLISSHLSAQRVDTRDAGWWHRWNGGRAMLVYLDGRLVYESYGGSVNRNTSYPIASCTKSFAACMAALAVADGLLTSLDERVSDTIVEWKTDANKSRITYRHLLSMSSGLAPGVNFSAKSYAESARAPSWSPPGARFLYGPNPYQAFGETMKRKLARRNKSVSDYLAESLLRPMGVEIGSWIGAVSGEPQLASGIAMRARELGDFGEFLRQRGRVGSKQIIPAALLDECLRVSSTNPEYRMGFWASGPGEGGPNDLFYAAGVGGQRVYVSRELGLVVVLFGSYSTLLDDEVFLDRLLPAWVGDNGAGCRGASGVPRLSGSGGDPYLGTRNFRISLRNAPDYGLGVYLLGFSRTSMSGVPLPFDFGILGMPGCFLRNSTEISSPFLADDEGEHRAPSPFPNVPSLRGKFIFVQAMLLDGRANAGGLTLSNSILVRVGRR